MYGASGLNKLSTDVPLRLPRKIARESVQVTVLLTLDYARSKA
jgi:hypothetical protein